MVSVAYFNGVFYIIIIIIEDVKRVTFIKSFIMAILHLLIRGCSCIGIGLKYLFCFVFINGSLKFISIKTINTTQKGNYDTGRRI